MTKLAEEYFTDPKAEAFEFRRDTTRLKHPKAHMLYDCTCAAVGTGHRVTCRKGHPVDFTLLETLKGIMPKECQTCGDFDGDQTLEGE